MSGDICRRCRFWNVTDQFKALAAKCVRWTEAADLMAREQAGPRLPFVMTHGHDTCRQFERAEHDENGERTS